MSMGFSRQEYWSGLLFRSPGDLPDPGIRPTFPALAGRFFTTEPLGKPSQVYTYLQMHPVVYVKHTQFLYVNHISIWWFTKMNVSQKQSQSLKNLVSVTIVNIKNMST